MAESHSLALVRAGRPIERLRHLISNILFSGAAILSPWPLQAAEILGFCRATQI
jgi:hypothetical protein